MSDTISDIPVAQPPPPPSERFSATDADLVVQSAEGVLFRLHTKYLEATTGGFAPPGFDSRNETIHLSERSKTLELLFQFVYPERHPGLSSIPFETLAPLAEAAEKYQVYAAMNVCQIRMMNVLPKHAEEVMAYAVKHDYPEIMYIAAPLLLDKPLEYVLAEFPPNIAIAWARYHGSWSTCIWSAITSLPVVLKTYCTTHMSARHHTEYSGCRKCARPIDTIITQIIVRLAKGVASLKDLDTTASPDLACCPETRPAIAAWRLGVENSIRQIPEFTAFV